MKTLRQCVAHNVKVLRLNKGWSQAQLAKKVGTSQTAISDLEHCRRWLEPEILERMLHVFGVKISTLFGEMGYGSKNPKQSCGRGDLPGH
jgi:transcriptional regulator with XRE-family HTH domain